MANLKDLLLSFLFAAIISLLFSLLTIPFESLTLHHAGASTPPRSCLRNKEIRKARNKEKKNVRFEDHPALRERVERKLDAAVNEMRGKSEEEERNEWLSRRGAETLQLELDAERAELETGLSREK
jgi:hypothetical protein